MTTEMLRSYTMLVEFLGRMLGPDYEIALHDLGRKKPSIAAIANGHISGRTVGAPLTNVAMQLIAGKAYENQDWKLNYRGVSASGRVLRCSTLFIKDAQGALTGLLCINFDDSRYQELSERVFALCHPDEYAAKNITISAAELAADAQENGDPEHFYNSISAATEEALLSVLNTAEIPAERLTQEERLRIIRLLDRKGVFALKGAIHAVAKSLSCSQASVYRYLSASRKTVLPEQQFQ